MNCGYLSWTFKQISNQIDNKLLKGEKNKKKKEKGGDQVQAKSVVTIPYITRVSEALKRTFRRHGFATSMKPYETLRQLLVHPKDKSSSQDSAGVVYSIPCKDSPEVYIGETGRRYGVREKENMKDVKQLEGVNYTRARKRQSQTEYHQSVLTDHAAVYNHTIYWEGVKLPAKDLDWMKRGIREAICIMKAGSHTINHSEGCHHLHDVYSKLMQSAAPPGGGFQKH